MHEAPYPLRPQKSVLAAPRPAGLILPPSQKSTGSIEALFSSSQVLQMGMSVVSTLQSTLRRFTRQVQSVPMVTHSEDVLEATTLSHRGLLSSASVNNIPPELLGIIFRFYTDATAGEILPILIACKYWQHVAMHTPDIWTLIRIKVDHYQYYQAIFDRHIQQILLCVKNSGSLPLDLEIDYGFAIPVANPDPIQEGIRRVFMELKGPSCAHAARWATVRLSLPSHNGRPTVGAVDCGLINLRTPKLTKLSIEMLAKPFDHDSTQSLPYLTDLPELRSLTADDEYILRHLPVNVEQLEHLDVRLSRQPFDAGELVRFPRLKTLILRHEEKGHSERTAFSPSTLELLTQPRDSARLSDNANCTAMLGSSTPCVPTLCIQSVWLMGQELPDLMPVTLAWDTLDPTPLGQFKLTGVAKHSLQTLFAKYSLSENLVLPGSLCRPFFLLVQQEPAMVCSLRKVIFDMGPEPPRVYNMLDGRLRRTRQRDPAKKGRNLPPTRVPS